MKLAILRRRFSSTGGAELYTHRLVAALHDAGHEIHLFAESWAKAPPGVAVHRVEERGSRAGRPRLYAERVNEELANDRFDCVFSLERTLKQDVYRAGDGVHRVWLERRKEFAPWWRRPFIGRGRFHRTMLALEASVFHAGNTGRIIANSEMVKGEILRHFPFPEDRIHIVRNGVEASRFRGRSGSELRSRLGLGESESLLLFVGSGWERKGLGFLLRALEQVNAKRKVAGSGLPPVKLLVVGKGRIPRRPPPDVIFAGPMDDVESAYAAADLFVFPPIYEPSANVCFEALAAGLPVVTTIQNGASELIREGTTGTVLRDPSDAMALARAMEFWIGDRSKVRVTAGFDFSLERNVAETVSILEQAAREKRSFS